MKEQEDLDKSLVKILKKINEIEDNKRKHFDAEIEKRKMQSIKH